MALPEDNSHWAAAGHNRSDSWSDKDDDDSMCLVAWNNAVQAHLPAEDQRRQAYEQRLATFRPETYFAKPPCLSPLVCARFGWRNVARDVLSCTNCRATICVLMHDDLSPTARHAMLQHYENQLMATHVASCPYGDEMRTYLRIRQQATKTALMVPPAFCSILPPGERAVLETIQLSKLRALYQDVLQSLLVATSCQLPPISPEITEFRFGDGDNSLPWPQRVRVMLQSGADSHDEMEGDLAVVFLVVFGWRHWPMMHRNDNEFMLECALCRAQLCISNTATAHSRSVDTAHRHYCPYVCGFPIAACPQDRPLWQALVNRILTPSSLPLPTAAAASTEQQWLEYRRLVKKGLSPRLVASANNHKPTG